MFLLAVWLRIRKINLAFANLCARMYVCYTCRRTGYRKRDIRIVAVVLFTCMCALLFPFSAFSGKRTRVVNQFPVMVVVLPAPGCSVPSSLQASLRRCFHHNKAMGPVYRVSRVETLHVKKAEYRMLRMLYIYL